MEFKPKNCRRWWRYICSERKQQVFDHSWRWRRSQHPGCDASINITGNGGNNSSLGSGGSHGHGGKKLVVNLQISGEIRKKTQSVCSIHQDRKTTVRFI